MLLYSNQGINQNIAVSVVITIAIANICLCFPDSLDDAIPIIDNSDLQAISENLASQTDQKEENVLHHLNVSEHPGELCSRTCVAGSPRICYFEFTLEYYQAMGVACGKCAQGVQEDCNNPQCIVADGIEKGVMSINRQIPGPAIQVCKDDIIIVDVHNSAHGTAAAIHWHGLHMVATPHMDGVPFVTQCPIPFTNSFRYQFYATEPGTQFYHSHAGHHKMNGQYGAFIVRRPEEPLIDLYNYDLPEHYILISDWMHSYAEQYFPGLPSSSGIYPDSVLINGKGVFTNPKTKARTNVRPTIYHVTSGKNYRFRMINSVSHACPFELQIENHTLTIIASDSFDVHPYPCDTLVSNSGERYDFILAANHTDGDFWMRVRGLGLCSMNPIESYALIRYESEKADNSENELQIPQFPSYEAEYPSGIVLNHPNATCWGGENDHCITELVSLEEDDDLRYATPDQTLYLSFQNYPVLNKEIFKTGEYHHFSNINSNSTIVGAINNITLSFPDYPPLTQPESIDESQFCNKSIELRKCEGRHLCPCIHRLQVKLNSIVELVIVDESRSVGRMHHPFHLHGHRFMVTDLAQHPYGLPMTIPLAIEMTRRHTLPRNNLNNPPFKDTVSIPSTGYAVVRLRATNPGFWLMHCHYEWHLAIGMGLILQVGDTSQMVTAPKDFPKCGNYIPPVNIPIF